jgi:hypothetical protein
MASNLGHWVEESGLRNDDLSFRHLSGGLRASKMEESGLRNDGLSFRHLSEGLRAFNLVPIG